MGRRLLLVASLAGVGAVWAIVFGWGWPPVIYSYSVSQFLKRGLADQTVRVQGTMVRGTLCRVTADCGYRFTLTEAGQQLPVVYEQCAVPDTLGDIPGRDVRVSVEGERCQSCHDFNATRMFVSVSGRYEMNAPTYVPAPVPLCHSVPRM
jgi:cytochrome c-type biogenesis protein CcmE